MKKHSFFRLLRDIKDYSYEGLTLQRRLFVFFLLFLVTVMLGLLLILFSTGIFRVGLEDSQMFMQSELNRIADGVERNFGVVSLQGVSLAKRLTSEIERNLQENDLTPSSLQDSPHSLESILDDCLDILNAALINDKTSAAFVVLNATINPELERAESSRSGLFLRNMLPDAAFGSLSSLRYLRGPASLARARNIFLSPQWQMEFTVAPDDFFDLTMEAANNSEAELSQLYLWNPKAKLSEGASVGMLLTLPLIAGDGTVLGVCGFEVSDMLFKMQYTPNNTTFARVFSILAPFEQNMIDASKALMAGSHTVISAGIDGFLEVSADKKGFYHFTSEQNVINSGLYQQVNLYPKDGIPNEQGWALGVVIPWQDLSVYITSMNVRIVLLLITLLAASSLIALFLSRKYIKPVINVIGKIRDKTYTDYEKTYIQEIDDLMFFLAEQEKHTALTHSTSDSSQGSFTLYEAFVENIETLSPAERLVFNLYMDGYTAKEIAGKLFLSINTIKTHNKRIYMKLNVSSRKELLVYVNMMKERDSDLFS